jgi:DNA polymerase-3 subunit alpha
MTPGDVSDREKAVWEKELLGVSFSEKPFSPVLRNDNDNVVFCGDIEAELDKQVIVTAGRVMAARYSFTKKGEAFVIVILEDVSGQVEVIAWPRVYSQTEEYWQEGNELIVMGKVRARDDEVNVVCDSVSFYEYPTEEKETASPQPPQPREKQAEAPSPIAQPVEKHRLIFELKQTTDKDGDIILLNKIIDVLKEYPGTDEVRLNIVNGGDAIPLKLPNVKTLYGPELEKRLEEVVASGSYRVETIT